MLLTRVNFTSEVLFTLARMSVSRPWRSPSLGSPAFYRFSERFYRGLHQSASPAPIYQTPLQWTRQLLVDGGHAPCPTWSCASGAVRPPDGGAQLWETTWHHPAGPERAAPPGPLLRLTPAEGRRDRGGAGRARGRRAGRRLQRRRHRHEREDSQWRNGAIDYRLRRQSGVNVIHLRPLPEIPGHLPAIPDRLPRLAPSLPAARPPEPHRGTVDADPDSVERLDCAADGPVRRPGSACRGDLYTRDALLQLRATATDRPSDAMLVLLRRMQIIKSHREDEVEQTECYQIPVRVTKRSTKQARENHTYARRGLYPEETPESCLLCPARLSLRQTKQAAIRAATTRSSTLKIGHLNVRSLTAHLDEVNLLLQTERLDVLCVGETWLTDAVDSSMLVLPGYDISRRDREAKKTGGGVAIIHRSSLNVERLLVPTAKSALESLWLQIISRSTIIVGVIYRPPAGPPTPAIEDLHSQLTRVMAKEQPIFLLGDTNFDVTRPDKPGVTSYLRHLQDLSLRQLVTEPTHPGSLGRMGTSRA